MALTGGVISVRVGPDMRDGDGKEWWRRRSSHPSVTQLCLSWVPASQRSVSESFTVGDCVYEEYCMCVWLCERKHCVVCFTRLSELGIIVSVIQDPNLEPDVRTVMGLLTPVSFPHPRRD